MEISGERSIVVRSIANEQPTFAVPFDMPESRPVRIARLLIPRHDSGDFLQLSRKDQDSSFADVGWDEERDLGLVAPKNDEDGLWVVDVEETHFVVDVW